MVYAVELVLQNNLRQGVIKELPGKQCHEVLEGGFYVCCPFQMEKHMTNKLNIYISIIL